MAALTGFDLDNTAVTPQSTYGSQKAMCELLINDYSRKGFVDGIVLRLPTICVRPVSRQKRHLLFVSSIIREPLHGEKCAYVRYQQSPAGGYPSKYGHQ